MKTLIHSQNDILTDILLVIAPPWGVDHPPMSLGYLARYLKDKEISYRIFDLNAELFKKAHTGQRVLWEVENDHIWRNTPPNEMISRFDVFDLLIDEITDSDVTVIGFSVVDPNQYVTCEVIRKIKKKCPQKIIVAGGPVCSTSDERKWLKKNTDGLLDFIIVGEGEKPLTELIRQINSSAANTHLNISGVVDCRYDNTMELHSMPSPLDLSGLSFPDYDRFDLSSYVTRVASVMWTRGCIANCAFCKEKSLWDRYRARTIQSILEELMFWQKKNISEFVVYDSLVNGNPKHLEALCDEIISKKLSICWSALAIPNKFLTKKLLKKMKQAGCFVLIYGLESGSEKVLKLMRKRFLLHEAVQTIRNTKSVGIKTAVNILVGFPGENQEDFEKTLNFIHNNHNYIDRIDAVTPLQLVRGTCLFNHYQEFGIQLPDERENEYWFTQDGLNNYDIRLERSRRVIDICSKYEIEIGKTFAGKKISDKKHSETAICSGYRPAQGNIMKIFLGNSPWNKKGYYGVRAGSRWPHFEEDHHEYMPFPFFLAYGAAILEQADHEVLLVDGIAEKITEKEFIGKINRFSPDLILLEVSTISIDTDLALAKKIRKLVGKSAAIAFSGLHAYMYEPGFLKQYPFIDFILVGEYEYTLRDLANHLKNNQVPDNVPGLICRDPDGNITVSRRRPLISDLDELPWPARHYLPMTNYHDEPGNIPRPSVQMQASRGCPFGCVFCAWPQIIYGTHKYRTRDPGDVADEFEWLVKIWGFESVYFDDDTFNIGEKRILNICRELKNRRLNTPWAAMCRADTMKPDMLEAMVDSGLHAVKYGVETDDQDTLTASGKALNIRKAQDTIRLTHELGVHTHLTFMFGLPGETREKALRTVDLALELNPESVQFTIATPFPGSRFYNELKEKGLITCDDFSKYDGFRSAVVRTESLSSRDLEEIVEKANSLWKQHISERKPRLGACDKEDFVSVIIPSFNGRGFLQPCLDSLMQQTKVNKEIILVDNGSRDGSADFVREHYPEVRVIALPENTGFAKAVNQGIKQAESPFIAVLNNDAVADSNWLETLCSYLSENPDVGFCASKIVKLDNPCLIDSVGHGIKRSGCSFNMGNSVRDSGQYNVRREVFGASAAGAVYRKTMLDDIGLFDENFFMYLEDLDLSFRAQLWGYKCAYVPEAVVRHVGAGTTGKQYHKDNVYYMARNSVYVMLKSMPREILKSHCFRILGFFIYLQLFHTFKTFHPWSCMKGLYNGLKDFRKMAIKRKRILGGKRVHDEHIRDMLVNCEKEFRQFKKLKRKT